MRKHYHFKTLLCLMLVLVSMLTTVASAATLRRSDRWPYSLTSSGTIDEGLDRKKTIRQRPISILMQEVLVMQTGSA